MSLVLQRLAPSPYFLSHPSFLFFFSYYPPVDVIQLNENDEYWLQLFPSRGVVPDKTYKLQQQNKDRIFTIPDGSVFYLRHCSLIKLPMRWYDVDMVSKLGQYNMTREDSEFGYWSIFPVVKESIFWSLTSVHAL